MKSKTTREARSLVFALLNSTQLGAVDELLGALEISHTEDAISSSDHEAARHRVLAIREARGLFKQGGQA